MPAGLFDVGAQAGAVQMMEAIEAQTAATMEQLVGGEGFSELLARVTENTVAATKLWGDFWELLLRSARLAGVADVSRLGEQLSRNEDKLELLLQAVERLEAPGGPR